LDKHGTWKVINDNEVCLEKMMMILMEERCDRRIDDGVR